MPTLPRISASLERLAFWYMRRRGIVTLPRGWRGLAIGGSDTVAVCEDYDNTKPSRFIVLLGPRAQLVAVNHSVIACDKMKIAIGADLEAVNEKGEAGPCG